MRPLGRRSPAVEVDASAESQRCRYEPNVPQDAQPDTQQAGDRSASQISPRSIMVLTSPSSIQPTTPASTASVGSPTRSTSRTPTLRGVCPPSRHRLELDELASRRRWPVAGLLFGLPGRECFRSVAALNDPGREAPSRSGRKRSGAGAQASALQSAVPQDQSRDDPLQPDDVVLEPVAIRALDVDPNQANPRAVI